ncbi:sulfonate transport system substrate-binding protein [Pseudomonas flavescens]|uniref:Sulfonate transport system substrate-binding protein n=1 Tax=Phytopseudomonas flavescens TaxID=29435 RepID=A0A1G7Y2I8_9GAMM|nr:ABC transporter substrate-binding protein [Pseudomonas flavescens]SDG90573.1 sulfonate transport system substrate-binding protein [Pseudomonas flavescens]
MKRALTILLQRAVLPGLLGLLGLLGCLAGSGALAQAPLKEIRIAVPDLSTGNTPSGGGVVDVLRAQQILEREFAADGIAIQWRFFKGAGPVVNEALANGQVDFAYLGDLAAIIGKANGLDTRLLSATARDIRLYLGVVPGSTVKTLADLEGKRVAIFRGTAYQLSFAQALASQGLRERDLQVVNLDGNAASAALAARQIDATWGGANLISLQQRGLAHLPLSTDDLGGAGSVQAMLVGTGAFVDAHPEVVERLLRAQQQAVRWLRDSANQQAYVALLADLSGYPRTLLQRDLEHSDVRRMFDPRLDADYLARLQAGVDLAVQQRLVRKGFAVAEWAAPGFLEAALRSAPGVTAQR